MPQAPNTLITACTLVGGAALIVLGLSFAWKFILAVSSGKVRFWTGLEHFGWTFIPVTLLTPLVTHLPADEEKTMIKTRQGPWLTLFYSPVFFLAALMFMTAGADQLGLPGSNCMNFVLTAGRPDARRAITYTPPFTYKFPIMKKISRTVFVFLTQRVYMDPKQKYQATRKSEELQGEGQALENMDDEKDQK